MQTFTIYRVIRIDAEYNPDRTTRENAEETAVDKVIADANAHLHTVEDGTQVTSVENCGFPA